jgi:hypothetical protein
VTSARTRAEREAHVVSLVPCDWRSTRKIAGDAGEPVAFVARALDNAPGIEGRQIRAHNFAPVVNEWRRKP